VKCHALAVVAAAGWVCSGCASSAPEDYPVDAVALLAPLRFDPPYVVGPIEVLGTGKPSSVPDSGPRTLAAYRVQLFDDLAPRIVVKSTGACRDHGGVLRPDGGGLQDLGVLRRVGEETHFFVPVQEDGQMIYVDTETTTILASPTGRFQQLVIAVSPIDSLVLACGELTWMTTTGNNPIDG
jgi:hypothetical protein